MESAAESEIGFTYINDQYAFPVQTCLIKMGHTQTPTKLQIDNTTAEALSKGTHNQNISESIDTNFYWIQHHEIQVEFNIFCLPGKDNLGDYHTKHHYLCHHCLIKSKFLHIDQLVHTLQLCHLKGCVKYRVNVHAHTHALMHACMRKKIDTSAQRTIKYLHYMTCLEHLR